MSDSDVLAIQLWWGAAAIAFLAVAMTAAGWNHRYFVRGMFGAAALLALVSIFWRRISEHLNQQITADILAMANSRVSWLVIFAIGIAAIMFIARAPNPLALKSKIAIFPDTSSGMHGGVCVVCARNAALEEAAKVCDRTADAYDRDSLAEQVDSARYLAAAIRALKT